MNNRFSDIQLHPSFWGGSLALSSGATGTGNTTSVGLSAGLFFEQTHTISVDKSLVPTTQISNLVIASFGTDWGKDIVPLSVSNGTINTGHNTQMNSHNYCCFVLNAVDDSVFTSFLCLFLICSTPGRAFIFAGDSGIVDISGFAMNNEQNALTHLWAANASSEVALRIRSAVLNYSLADDILVRQTGATV